MTLIRPCTNTEFRAHYADCTVTEADYGYLIAVDSDGNELDIWGPHEQLPAAIREVLEQIRDKPLFQAIQNLYTQKPLTPSGITEMRKGKRHRPSRYRL